MLLTKNIEVYHKKESVMHNPFLYAFLSRLKQADIQYAIMRGWKDIPDTMDGGDLDMCVAPAHYERTKRIISETLAQTDGCVVSFLDSLMAPRYCFLALDWGLQLDVCPTSIQYRCANFMPEDFIWKNTIDYKGYKVLSPNADIYLAFMKEMLNNGFSHKEEYITNLRIRLKTATEDEIKTNLSVYSDATIQLLKEQVSDVNRRQYSELVKALRKDIHIAGNIRYMRNQLMKLRRLFCHPGYVIAVLGTDGSGKSTIIDAITPWLDQAFHKGVLYKHFRPGLLPDLGVVFHKRNANAPKVEVVDNPHSGKPSGFIGSLMRLIYYILDFMFGYFKQIWPKIAMHTKVFIFDRYYYDYYIDQRRSLINLPKWIVRLGEIFVPKPDIVLCLGGDPKKIYARKPETSLKEVIRQTEELQHFASHRKNAVWIDTTQPIENSIRDAKTAILKMMSTRFKNVL